MKRQGACVVMDGSGDDEGGDEANDEQGGVWWRIDVHPGESFCCHNVDGCRPTTSDVLFCRSPCPPEQGFPKAPVPVSVLLR